MKRMIALGGAALAVVTVAYAEMEPATPESQGVSSQAILDWINACERTYDAGVSGSHDGALHGFVIVRHGKVIAEGSWKPFDTLNETHLLYSHSKSFTSSAIGFLVDEGKLDLDARVIDFFPDDVPENPSENIRQLRVRDLLTMNVGAEHDHMVGRHPDWAKAFFKKDFKHAPGTRFKYDSDATYLLAAIAEKKSGQKLMDYLKVKMFDKIGITRAWSNLSPQGIACGGWGMNMTTREIARFGQLYLQHGFWEGRNVISPQWVALASTRQTWSGWQNVGVKALGEGGDWEQGYGFQFWRCTHNGYRADGAFGQYTFIMPEQDAVISINAGLVKLTQVPDLVWQYLLPAMKDGALPENEAALTALRAKTAALAIAPIAGAATSTDEAKLLGDYQIDTNKRGFRAVRIVRDGDGWKLRFYARRYPLDTPVGHGEWRHGKMLIDPEHFECMGKLIGEQPTAASAAFAADGSLRCRVYLTGTPSYLDFQFFLKDGIPSLKGELWGMNGTNFKGRKWGQTPDDKWGQTPDDKWGQTPNPTAVQTYFTQNVFGVRPVERPDDLTFEVVSENDCIWGQALHKVVKISTKGVFSPFSFITHAYVPKKVAKMPAMVAINLTPRLEGQSFAADAEDPSTKSWPIRDIIARGVATIGFKHGDVARDDNTCFETGVFKAFGPAKRKANSWGALSAWAWGASRCCDWLLTQDNIDAKRIGVIGHSRGGKTAIWAGVTDDRFSLVCVNNSGCTGAKPNRLDLPWSESIDAITSVFPHWFAPHYRTFATDDGRTMTYDQPDLMALIKPRKIVIGSATQDVWAGPEGEEWAARQIGAVHFWREGPHDLTPSDWAKYLEALKSDK